MIKTRGKVLLFLLLLTLILTTVFVDKTIFPMSNFAAEAADEFNYELKQPLLAITGTGTFFDPYIISSATDYDSIPARLRAGKHLLGQVFQGRRRDFEHQFGQFHSHRKRFLLLPGIF
jgi:hypothetical protein